MPALAESAKGMAALPYIDECSSTPPSTAISRTSPVGGAVVRVAAEQERLAGARRKSITLSFARLAAWRFMRAAEVLQAEGAEIPQAAEPAIE